MHFLPPEANRRCANHRQLHGFEREMFGKRDQANADRANATPDRNAPRKANGAGIATDPTLTSAWSSLPANLPRSAWRSMSHLPTGWEPIVTGARTGIRSRFSADPTLLGRSLSKRCQPSGATETIHPSRLLPSSGRFLPQLPPSIVPQPGSWPIQWICDRVLLKQLHLLPACTFCMSSLKDRVDNHHCVGCSEKLS